MEWVIGIYIAMMVFQLITMIEVGCIEDKIEELMKKKKKGKKQ